MSNVNWAALGFLALAVGAGGALAEERRGATLAPLAAKSLLLDLAPAGDRLVAVGDRGHIVISADGGRSWRQVAVPTSAMLTAVHFVDDRRGWAVGHDAVILHTADGGETWRLVHEDVEADSPLFDVFFTDSTRGFAIGAYGLFLDSRDGGATWTSRTISDDDAHLHHLARSASGRLFIAAERGNVLRSDDGGEHWQALPSPYTGSLFGSLPLAGDSVLLFGLRGHAFLSEDAGMTWREVATGVDAMLTGACRLADGRIVVVGLAGVILVSGDGGHSFTLQVQSDRLGISAVVPADDGGLVLAGEFGVRREPLAASAAAAK